MDPGSGGGRYKAIRNASQNGCLIHTITWIRDIGCDPPPLPGTGGIPQLVLPTSYWQISLEAAIHQMGVATHKRGYGGGWTGSC